MATGDEEFAKIEHEGISGQVADQQEWAFERAKHTVSRILRETTEGRLSRRDAERQATAMRVDLRGRSN